MAITQITTFPLNAPRVGTFYQVGDPFPKGVMTELARGTARDQEQPGEKIIVIEEQDNYFLVRGDMGGLLFVARSIFGRVEVEREA